MKRDLSRALQREKLARFEIADKSTLFLDEIGELPTTTQAKLLQVLQEQEFERVGGTETIRTDVRIIAATNQDLRTMVAEKKFREDLFYRLNIFPVHVPPLRERREDIPLLGRYFADRFCQSCTGPGLISTKAPLTYCCATAGRAMCGNCRTSSSG